MARILILTHRRDLFQHGGYALNRYIDHWVREGHRVLLAPGPEELPDADVAILHVDLSVLPHDYSAALQRYPIVVNGRTRDIRKRAFSKLILQPGEAWDGPVIVKTELNYGGWMEARELRASRHFRVAPDLASTPLAFMNPKSGYPIFQSIHQVPMATWSNPGLEVERFILETDPKGFVMNHWVFFGDQGSCYRVVSSSPIVKASGILEWREAEVPEEIRAERQRLGFDFGKFDYIIHQGTPILLDANRTPGAAPRSMDGQLAAVYKRTARGLEAFLRLGARNDLP